LLEVGGFHPWLTIEDPEVGMRLWKAGKRLAVTDNDLIDEVPDTFAEGIKQRKRWIAGFFQSLSNKTLKGIGMTFWERVRARMLFVPTLSLAINLIGLPINIIMATQYFMGWDWLPQWAIYPSAINCVLFAISLFFLYRNTWRRTALVMNSVWSRLYFMLRVNPIFLMLWWALWAYPIIVGYIWYRRDLGLVWDRTNKVDANRDLLYVAPKQIEYDSMKEVA
jgi:glycosyltransferase XagB